MRCFVRVCMYLCACVGRAGGVRVRVRVHTCEFPAARLHVRACGIRLTGPGGDAYRGQSRRHLGGRSGLGGFGDDAGARLETLLLLLLLLLVAVRAARKRSGVGVRRTDGRRTTGDGRRTSEGRERRGKGEGRAIDLGHPDADQRSLCLQPWPNAGHVPSPFPTHVHSHTVHSSVRPSVRPFVRSLICPSDCDWGRRCARRLRIGQPASPPCRWTRLAGRLVRTHLRLPLSVCLPAYLRCTPTRNARRPPPASPPQLVASPVPTAACAGCTRTLHSAPSPSSAFPPSSVPACLSAQGPHRASTCSGQASGPELASPAPPPTASPPPPPPPPLPFVRPLPETQFRLETTLLDRLVSAPSVRLADCRIDRRCTVGNDPWSLLPPLTLLQRDEPRASRGRPVVDVGAAACCCAATV